MAVVCAWLSAGALWYSPGTAQADPLTLLGETMGTTYRVRVATAPATSDSLKPRIDALLERINNQMSTYRPQSELSRLNANDSRDWIAVSSELYSVLAAAREVSIASDGAFDITVGPLVNLWGFGPQARIEQPPAQAAIAATLARVGYRQLDLAATPPRVRKARSDLYLDLSAIAKGYAVDEVAALLEGDNIKDYLVDIGGEIRARGHNAQGAAWQVGVALPVANVDDIERVLPLSDTGLATSGDYRNFFEFEGRRYSHEIDPASGRPIANDVASVSVLHASCMMADAYATAFMVMGAERGLALAKKQGLRVLFLLRDGDGFTARATPDFPASR
jgi:thiamine biosynthesis lipoprotein